MKKLDELLEHSGVKGMKWGVIRSKAAKANVDKHNAKKEARKRVIDKVKSAVSKKSDTSKAPAKPKEPSRLKKELSSLKRERQWKQVGREANNMSTKDINKVTRRIQMENDLKRLSKSTGSKKDKEDYLRRENMSSQELSRKVNRLRAKENLNRSISDASKSQMELGKRIVQTSASLGIKYALTGQVTAGDAFKAVTMKPNGGKERVKQLAKEKFEKNHSNKVLVKRKPKQ